MAKHTPGPWYRGKNGRIYSQATKDDINHLVDDATYEANENLKAAAPTMLDALEKLELNLTEAQSIIRGSLPGAASLFNIPLNEARTALALAKGAS